MPEEWITIDSGGPRSGRNGKPCIATPGHFTTSRVTIRRITLSRHASRHVDICLVMSRHLAQRRLTTRHNASLGRLTDVRPLRRITIDSGQPRAGRYYGISNEVPLSPATRNMLGRQNWNHLSGSAECAERLNLTHENPLQLKLFGE